MLEMIVQNRSSSHRRSLAWWLYQPYKFLLAIPVGIVSTLLFGSLAIVLSAVLDPRQLSFICGVLWAKLNACMAPMRVRVSGRDNVEPGQSYVIVSNHQSHYDVFALYGWLGVDFRWVMKHELRRIPGLGIGCEKVGHIFIDRSDHEAALRSLDAAKSKIVNGTSVFFFPEGTRSPDGRLRSFKKGAFRMALDLGLPLLPVTLVGTRHVLPPGTMDLFPGTVELIIHQAVATEGLSEADLPALMERVRSRIDDGLRASPA